MNPGEEQNIRYEDLKGLIDKDSLAPDIALLLPPSLIIEFIDKNIEEKSYQDVFKICLFIETNPQLDKRLAAKASNFLDYVYAKADSGDFSILNEGFEYLFNNIHLIEQNDFLLFCEWSIKRNSSEGLRYALNWGRNNKIFPIEQSYPEVDKSPHLEVELVDLISSSRHQKVREVVLEYISSIPVEAEDRNYLLILEAHFGRRSYFDSPVNFLEAIPVIAKYYRREDGKITEELLDKVFQDNKWKGLIRDIILNTHKPEQIRTIARAVAKIDSQVFENCLFEQIHILSLEAGIDWAKEMVVICLEEGMSPEKGVKSGLCSCLDTLQFLIDKSEDRQICIDLAFDDAVSNDNGGILAVLLSKRYRASANRIRKGVFENFFGHYNDFLSCESLSLLLQNLDSQSLEKIFLKDADEKMISGSTLGNELFNIVQIAKDRSPKQTLCAIINKFPKTKNQFDQIGILETELIPNLQGYLQLRDGSRPSKSFLDTHAFYLVLDCLIATHAFLPEASQNERENLFGVLLAINLVGAAKFKGRPKEYVRTSDKRSLSGVEDLIDELRDSLLLPAVGAKRTKLTILEKLDIDSIDSLKHDLDYTSARLLVDDLTTYQLRRFNFMWHQPRHQMPLNARPLLMDAKWYPLFPEVKLDHGITISCLTSQIDLNYEGQELSHCVGRGGYAYDCLRGDSHIVTIRKNDRPIATLELHFGDYGDIELQDGDFLRVDQFKGQSDGDPPDEAKLAWREMGKLLKNNEVHISNRLGSTTEYLEESKDILPWEQVTGIRATEYPVLALEYWSSLTIRDDSNQIEYQLLSDPFRTLMGDDVPNVKLVLASLPAQ